MISVKDLHKKYSEGAKTVSVLKGITMEIAPAKKIGVVGASGTGKSTLLHILGGLDQPTQGSVWVENNNLYSLSEQQRARLRNHHFGFIFQFYHLLPELTALENGMLPALIAGRLKNEASIEAQWALSEVGLKDRFTHLPSQLSGGEQQRVALARGCILKPKVLLADEPTGNLDEVTGEEVLAFLFSMVTQVGGSLILVTHNPDLTQRLDEVYELKDGQLHSTY